MDKLRCIAVFVEVARGLSFSAAADRLGMARGSVTKHVAWLEASLGVQLLARTTKSVALTEAGHAMYEHGIDLLEQTEQIDAAVRRSVSLAKGTIRVGATPSFGSIHLIPALTAFSEQHPDIQVALHFDYGHSDLVTEGLDISLRIVSALKDSSQVAYPLAILPQYLVASPSYLAKHGQPSTVNDLLKHNCLVHALKSPTSLWEFDGANGRESARVSGSLRSNFGEALRHAALLGHGISLHLNYLVAQDIERGDLQCLLPTYTPIPLSLYAVIASRNKQPIRVRTLLDFLVSWFRSPTWKPVSHKP
jgi:DNA-binding transcriptional LysR family regulator